MEEEIPEFPMEDYTNLFTTDNDTMNNSETNNQFPERPESYIVPVIFALIFVIGLIGNGAIIIMYLRQKIYRNIPNTYILSMALVDLLVIIALVPLKSVTFTLDSWIWGNTMCQITEAAEDISISVSAFTLTAFSVRNYISIAKESHYTLGVRPVAWYTVVTIIVIWILAALLSIPAYIESYVHIVKISSSRQIRFCNPYPEERGPGYPRTVTLVKFLVYYSLPLAIITIFYLLIACHLAFRSDKLPKELQYKQIQLQIKTETAVTVLIIALIFAACFLPTQVFMMWLFYSPTAKNDYNDWWHTISIVGFCLPYLKCCINPIVLYCRDDIFKQYFKRYLLCRRSSAHDIRESISLSTNSN